MCEAEAFEGAVDSFTLGGGRALQVDAANAAIRTQLPPSDFRVDVKVRMGDGDFYSVFGIYPSAEDATFAEDDAYGDMDLMNDSLFVDLQTSGNAGIRNGAEVIVGDLHPNQIADGDVWSLLGQDGDIVVLRDDVEMARLARPADDIKLVIAHHGAGPAGGFVECRWLTGAAMGPDAARLAICDEGDVQERGCALGDAGTESRTCVDGGWEPWTACLGPDGGALVWEGRAAGFEFDGADIGHLADDDAGAAIRTHTALDADFDLTGQVQMGNTFLMSLGAYGAAEDASFDFDDSFGGMSSMTNSFFMDGRNGGGARSGAGGVSAEHGGMNVGDVYGVHRRRGTLFMSRNGAWFETFAGTVVGGMRGVIAHPDAVGDGVWEGVTIARGDDVVAAHSVGSCQEELFTGNLDGFIFGGGDLLQAGTDGAAVRADLPEADFKVQMEVEQDDALRFFMTFGVYSAADDGSFDPDDPRGGLDGMATSISVDLNGAGGSGIRVGNSLCVPDIQFFATTGSVWTLIGRNGTVEVHWNGVNLLNFCAAGAQIPAPQPAGAMKLMVGHHPSNPPAVGFRGCDWKTGAALPD